MSGRQANHSGLIVHGLGILGTVGHILEGGGHAGEELACFRGVACWGGWRAGDSRTLCRLRTICRHSVGIKSAVGI